MEENNANKYDYQTQYQHTPEQATKDFYKFPLDATECQSIRLLWDRWVEFWEHGDTSNTHLGLNLYKISEKLAGKTWQTEGFRTHDGINNFLINMYYFPYQQLHFLIAYMTLFFQGYLIWSISIIELVQLIESKAFSVLQFLCNSIQQILDTSQDLGPESRARLEVKNIKLENLKK